MAVEKIKCFVIGSSFTCDWLGKWRKFSEPITERSKALGKQRNLGFDNFDIQLKIAVLILSIKTTCHLGAICCPFFDKKTLAIP